MLTFLLIAVIILAILLFTVIIWLWWQFNNTDSRLFKIVEDRIGFKRAIDSEELIDEEDI